MCLADSHKGKKAMQGANTASSKNSAGATGHTGNNKTKTKTQKTGPNAYPLHRNQLKVDQGLKCKTSNNTTFREKYTENVHDEVRQRCFKA